MHPRPTQGNTTIYRTWWQGQRLSAIIVDDVYAPELLEVEGVFPGGGSFAFEYDQATRAWISSDLTGLALTWTDPLELRVRNPAAVAAGDDPVTARIPATAAYTRGVAELTLAGMVAEAAGGYASGSALDPETGSFAAFGGQFAYRRGWALRAIGNDWGTWYFDGSATAQYCLVNAPSLDAWTIGSDELDGCTWNAAHDNVLVQLPDDRRDVPVPAGAASTSLVVVRYPSSGTAVNRMAVGRYLTPASGTGTAGASVWLSWVTFKL
jgi:hypothetical protein